MGKISEALKKAGKGERSRLVVRKETVVVQGSAAVASNPQPQPERPIPVPLVDRAAPPQPAGVAPTAEPTEKVNQFAPATHSKPIVAPVGKAADPGVAQERMDAVGRTPSPHDQAATAKAQTFKPNQAPASMPPARLVVPEAGRHGPPAADTPPDRRPIQVSYSETKVQALDREKLKNNCIFSIFDEIETTNQIKILRTQVLKKLAAIGGNSLLVTSANPHEGKTFTSINLGVSIAKEFSRTVLIIDADLRKPTKRHAGFSTDFFSIDVDVGLTDYLKGEADIRDILINPGIERLTLIPAGRPVDNAPELLNSTRMAEMMNEVKTRYGSQRLVIVDGPALLPFPDAMILSTYVDGVLPVVELERTPADQLKRMVENLKGTHIIGTVLNKNKG